MTRAPGPDELPRLTANAIRDYAVVALDTAGHVTGWNPESQQIKGYRDEEIIGQHFSVFYTPEDIAGGKPALALAAAAEQGSCRDAGWCVRQDGTRFYADVVICAMRDAAGVLRGFVEVTHDVTERQRETAERNRALECISVAASAAGLGFWDYNPAGNTLHWDDVMYRLYGRSVQDGEQPYALWARNLHPEDRARCEREVADAIAGTQAFDTTFRVVHPNEEIRYLRAAGKVSRDATGRALQMYGVNFDVTEQVESRNQLAGLLAENAALLSTLHKHALVSVADNRGKIIDANDAFCALSGYAREELLGRDHRIVNSGTHPKAFWTEMWQTVNQGASWRREVCNRSKNGALYWVDSMITPFRDPRTGSMKYISIRFDITQGKANALHLIEAARFDKLTGLANRALFMTRLEKAMARVRAGLQAHYAVLFLDFDRFKLVNDTLGHEAGDELLRQIALRLRGDLRGSDLVNDDDTGNVVSRFGGDEFLLLINDLKAPADAVRIAERLLNTLMPSYEILGSEVHSTASIGIATSEQGNATAEEAVAQADVAMYEAKHAGRGCSVVFNEAMHTRLTRHVQIESSLRRALGTDELSVVYQPIIELATGKMASAEALVRWQHPTLGAVSPEEFIPIAEECGLIIALDEWVLNQACQAMVQWRQADPGRAPQTISVNVSRAELALGDRLLDKLRGTLARVGLPPQCLQLEITEREVMRRPEAALKLMQDLQQLGVRLAMDDFGTGTSSLGLLRDFPFNTIKIDRSFVHGLSGSRELMAVIHATIILVENLNMASLVEGVEDPAQLAILQSLGCRYAQGYLFGRPVPAAQLLDGLPAPAPKEPA